MYMIDVTHYFIIFIVNVLAVAAAVAGEEV
jgi:hypothetical protein